MTPTKHKAIQTALVGNWEMAITINEEILQEDPQDIETLNRLAFAYTVVGKTDHAKKAYRRVLQIDIFNPIAIKNLKRLGDFVQNSIHAHQPMNNMFLEETGKTKIVGLINTAPTKILRTLQLGQQLKLSIKRSKIFIIDEDNQYIGMLPDIIGRRLIKFIEGTNTYEVCVKAVEDNRVTVFIKEIKRAAKFKDQPSFIAAENNPLSFKKELNKQRIQSRLASEEDED